MAEAGCHHFFSFNKPKQGTPPWISVKLTARRPRCYGSLPCPALTVP
jgi:hypothetical protein